MDGNDEVPILPIWESVKHLRDGQALLHEAKEEAEKSARPAIIATLIPPIPTPTFYIHTYNHPYLYPFVAISAQRGGLQVSRHCCEKFHE